MTATEPRPTPPSAARKDDLWLRADELLALLKQEAIRTGDKHLRVTRTALSNWVHRGHVEYRRDRGYRVTGGTKSVVAYLERRGARGLRRLST